MNHIFDPDSPRLNDDLTINFDAFMSTVTYNVPGTVIEIIEGADDFRHTSEFTEMKYERTVSQTVMLHANIINVDAYLDPDVLYDAPDGIKLDGTRRFIPDYSELVVELDLNPDEVAAAAFQRASEDKTEPAYVLGRWAYLERNASHVDTNDLEATFDERNAYFDNPPGDESKYVLDGVKK